MSYYGTSADLKAELAHCLTRYDRKQAGRQGYNRYVLGIYLKRGDEVCVNVAAGQDLGEALADAFEGGLLDHCRAWFGITR